MKTDQQGLFADEKEEENSYKKQKITQIEQPEISVDKEKSTIPLQHTKHKTQSTSVDTERSKETDGKMPLFGNEWQNMGAYDSESQKEAFLGTEESKCFSSNMHKFQGKEPFICIESSSKEISCLMSNVHGTEASGECDNTTTSNPKGKISLIGVRRQKNGRYGAVITDTIRHKQVWLGTFDTVEEASQAYSNKKLELENEKLKQQQSSNVFTPTNSGPTGKRSLLGIRKQKTGRYGAVITDQIRHKQVWLGTFDTVEEASQAYFSKKIEFEKLSQQDTGGVDRRIKSHETAPHIIEFHQNKMSEEEPESSKETPCLMVSVHGAESSDECNTSTSNPKAKIRLIGVRRQKNGRYGAVITDTARHKKVWLGTFDTVDEASQAYFSKKSELENEKLNQHEPTNECNTTASILPTAKRSLLGIRRQKNGRYGAVIRDQIRHKQVWLGTFDTVEEASQAYFSKKTEFEKLSHQVNKEPKPKENCAQIQQPGSPVVLASLSVANDQTSGTATVGKRNRRIDSHETTTNFVEVQKNNMSGKEPESSKEIPCLMARERGTEPSDECNTSTSNPKAKIGLIGVRRQKNGRYGAVIRDRTRHKQLWLGTFDTVEEASQAYLSKKSEFKKLDQQNNKENKPKKSCDQVQQPESPVMTSSSGENRDQTLNTAQVSRRNKRIDSHKTRTHFLRVHKRKDSGKYTSEIKNPITKKRIWLGTFVTAVEAYQAYQYKKLEFQKLVDAKGQCRNEQTHSKQDGESEKLVNVKKEHENVNSELESAGGSEIDAQISNSSNGVTKQRIDSHEIGTAEEAFYAYLSKKLDLQSSEKVKLQNDMPTDSSIGEEKQEGQEDDEDLWMGEWVQLPGNRAVKFSVKLGLPIVDNYGSLLGEFSTLDDLSIYRTEDGNET
ncbi:unnamed protein product [Withania somnifera]